MNERVTVTTKNAETPTGPNSRVRMGEYVLAVVRTPLEPSIDPIEDPLTSLSQEVPRVN